MKQQLRLKIQHLRAETSAKAVRHLPLTGNVLGSALGEVDFGASTTEGTFYDLVRKAGGEVIFIYCQACVSLGMKGHCCLL